MQLVCLSATLPNIEDIAKWLDASLYTTAFRPVKLQHRVCWNRAVFKPAGGSGVGGKDGAKGKLEKVPLPSRAAFWFVGCMSPDCRGLRYLGSSATDEELSTSPNSSKYFSDGVMLS